MDRRARAATAVRLRRSEPALDTILFFSPWLFSLSAGAPWQTTSPTIGLLVALLSMAALAAFAGLGGMAQLGRRAVPSPVALAPWFSE